MLSYFGKAIYILLLTSMILETVSTIEVILAIPLYITCGLNIVKGVSKPPPQNEGDEEQSLENSNANEKSQTGPKAINIAPIEI